MSVGILVVDDDASFALEIEMMIDELGYKYLGNPKNNFQTLEAIGKERPDLIIMDIDIEGAVDGITLAETIAYKKIPVIYITGFKSQEYFNRAKKTVHVAYLVKPFHMLTLRSVVEKAIFKVQNSVDLPENTNPLFVKNNNRFHKVLIPEIKWVEVDGNYCYLFVEDKKHVIKMSLKKILENINQQNIFLRIHRNFIVQKAYITNFNLNNNTIKIDEKSIPVGRKYKSQVVALLKNI